MNVIQKKIKKISSPLAVIFSLASLFLLLSVLLIAVSIIILLYGSQAALDNSLGGLSILQVFVPNPNNLQNELLASSLIGEFFRQGFSLGIALLAALLFRDIHRTGTPFAKKNVNRLEGISILLLAVFLLPPLFETLAKILLIHDLEEFSFSFSLTGLLLVVIFYALARIFDYGRMLQTEADETL